MEAVMWFAGVIGVVMFFFVVERVAFGPSDTRPDDGRKE